uniref:Uncharacterized protein n=1 Tax=Mycena chlorophos TaxID=658473 RepID=A0ABQ0KUL0_MYCCL|nr:predicted protein [Mycena chlorophos]
MLNNTSSDRLERPVLGGYASSFGDAVQARRGCVGLRGQSLSGRVEGAGRGRLCVEDGRMRHGPGERAPSVIQWTLTAIFRFHTEQDSIQLFGKVGRLQGLRGEVDVDACTRVDKAHLAEATRRVASGAVTHHLLAHWPQTRRGRLQRAQTTRPSLPAIQATQSTSALLGGARPRHRGAPVCRPHTFRVRAGHGADLVRFVPASLRTAAARDRRGIDADELAHRAAAAPQGAGGARGQGGECAV